MQRIRKRLFAMAMAAVMAAGSIVYPVCPGTAGRAEAAGTIVNPADYYAKVSRSRVSVHDPSVIRDPETGRYYIFGSHMAWAYSDDLETWKTFRNNINTDYKSLFAKEIEWAKMGNSKYDPAGNLWAPDVIWNKKLNKWCMYMSVNGDSWNSVICMLTADSLSGNWTYVGPVVYSGFTASGVHDYTKTDYKAVTGDGKLQAQYIQEAYTPKRGDETLCDEPTTWAYRYGAHAIDPCVFYDETGKLWFSYGSWSGGIYIFELDEDTGFRNMNARGNYTDAYMGKKIGGSSASGEASYIEYINGYYYLFLSYGELVARGGYNMRVFRSQNPDGPYTDVSGNAATEGGDVNGTGGKVGTRLMGYYKWSYWNNAQVAQGHNSALLDRDGKAYVVYHTRTDDGTEVHTVRVHQLFTTKDGYLTAAPFEYSKTDRVAATYSKEQIVGKYEVLWQNNTDHAALQYNEPKQIELMEDGKVSGDLTGTWEEESGSARLNVTLGGVNYQGTFVEQTMEETNIKTLCFTVVGANGAVDACLWGYKYPTGKVAVSMAAAKVSLPKRISEDLVLPKEGPYGTTIDWSFDSPFVLEDGTVIRPKVDVAAKATATISKDGESYEKNMEVTITAEQAGASKVASFYVDKVLDLSAGTTYSVENPLKGMDISNGVNLKFTLERKSDSPYLASIFAFNTVNTPADTEKSSGRMYFTAGSYLGYNAAGGFFDANVKNSNPWAAGTDYVGSNNKKVRFEVRLRETGYFVLADGVEIYSNATVDAKKTLGGNSIKDYGNVLDWLSKTASYLNFGFGAWDAWQNDKFKGTLSDFEVWVEPVEGKKASGNTYYSEDYEGSTDVTSLWTGAITARKETGDTNYVNIAPTGSGNRSTKMSFGLETQPEGEYVFETDAMLTSSMGGNGSTTPVTQFVLSGTDLVHGNNDKATAGYILKLSAEGVNNQKFTINDTEETVDIPASKWIHIKVEMNSADRTKAKLTITEKAAGTVITSKDITANGTGEIAGIFLLLGRGTSSSVKLDNTLIKKPGIADYAELNTLVAKAERYVKQNTSSPIYSEASMNALNKAIQEAKNLDPVLADDQQAQVDRCAEALKAAMAGLTCKQHAYNQSGTIVVKATCVQEGKEEITCCQCGATEEVTIAKVDHMYGDWITTKQATVAEEGERVKKCTSCGTIMQTEKIAKLPPVNNGAADDGNNKTDVTGNGGNKTDVTGNGDNKTDVTGNGDNKTDVTGNENNKTDVAGNGTTSDNIVKKGGIYAAKGMKYKITSITKKTVTFVEPSKKTIAVATVGTTVSLKGLTYKVTAIGSKAFANCKKLKKVTIGANVTGIGSRAFYKNAALKFITIKSGRLKSVGSQALRGIYKKAVIKVPASKLKSYMKLFKKKGQASSVKIRK